MAIRISWRFCFSPGQFFLNLLEGHSVDDGWMVILNIVHWSFSAVSLVGEHIHDHALAEADGFAGDIIVLSLHHLGNIVHGFSSQIEIEDAFHDSRFTRYDFRLTVSTLFIAKEPLV